VARLAEASDLHDFRSRSVIPLDSRTGTAKEAIVAFSEIETTTLKECVRLLNKGGWTVRQCRLPQRDMANLPVTSAELLVWVAVKGESVLPPKPHAFRLSLGQFEPLIVPLTSVTPRVTVRLIDGVATIIKVHEPVRREGARNSSHGNLITFIHRANFEHAQAPFKAKKQR
jgi:hypothetical protein